MPNWKKVIVSGSDASLNSLNVTAGVTGSLLGTASFASTASFINPLNQNVVVTGSLTVYGPNTSLNLPIYPPNYYYPTLTIATTTFQGYQTSGNIMTITNTGYTIEFGSNRGYMRFSSAGDHYFQSGGNNTRLFISSSGRMGIAKSSSLNATLDIIGDQVITGSLIVSSSNANQLQVGSNLVYVSSSGNVGIGTTSPNAPLDVNGKIYSRTGGIYTDNINTYNAANLNYSVGANSHIFKVNGSERFRIDTSGNVGVGTTTPNTKLDVNGNVLITGSASNSLRVKGSGTTNATNALLVENSSGVATFSVDDAGVTRMGPAGSEYMIVKNTLNVGINNSTPTAFLHVRSNQTNGSTFVFLAQNQDAVTFSGNNGGIGTIMAIKDNYTVVITGSTTITGSLVVTGSTTSTLGFTGSFLGTASYAAMALTASYALSSAGGGGGSTFPYTGSAIISGSLEVTGSFSVFTGSATEFQVNATGVKIGNVAGDIHTITGSVYISSISSSEERVLTTVSGGLVTSSAQVLIQAYIDPLGTIAGYLNSTSSWDINGDYSGSVISGTYQGQKHYNSNYFFEAVDDNVWIRLIRG